ncbi:hypothetical protein AAG906_001700 [Vitis piasezkii]
MKAVTSHTAIPFTPQFLRPLRRNAPPPNLPFLTSFLASSSLLRTLISRFSSVAQVMNLDLPMMGNGEFDEDFVVESCIVRSLSPALTLKQGLEKIKDAVEELKLNPPCSRSGLYRFQVAVPPSAKAMNWFFSQPLSSAVFPLFFLSKETENLIFKSLSLGGTCGVFGIGAAVRFTCPSFSTLGGQNSFKRYLSIDSTCVTAYGFMNANFNEESSSMRHEAGSFYIFIPQIELDEDEGISILSATLAWSDSPLSTFEESIHSYELSLYQALHSLSTIERYDKCIRSTLRKFDLVKDATFKMVYMKASSLSEKGIEADLMELETPFSCQFCIRLSPTVTAASNMDFSSQDYANINALWASLIIEECTRFGLMLQDQDHLPCYCCFHSSLTTCIACFDERSLAFHALGYARGSHKPAVVITSSGTAVSNLLPAVNHFGSFVRFFFGLPVPTDHIPARMILTTLDSAVYWATSSPCGPVHINCPFREPLENSPKEWMLSCLKGLDSWMSSAEPFTKYIQLQHSHAPDDSQGQMAEVIEVIQGAKRGLLLIGAITTEDDIWAALLLAKHLCWPVVADILSGLRLRKLSTSFQEIEDNVLFLDHLDHALLSDFVRVWAQADVIIQIGSRITSKRISQMIEDCFPCSYIMVDKHPCRHDPSHLLTHRIQSTITQFADCLCKAQFPLMSSKWSVSLRALDMMVAQEISSLIHSESFLTEPYVAHVILEALTCDSALFIGNSMAIRDADMYAQNSADCTHRIGDTVLSLGLPFHWIRVSGNRGASGIDGLLSTAIGFAVGCNKRVLCVIGDVSFLYDTNGLSILRCAKPMTILVLNNHGGAIFSLLPIAERTERRVLDQYFYTSHNVSIGKLCLAHGADKIELQDALFTSQQENRDCVIEVESCIDSNAAFHSTLRKFACQAADHALNMLSKFSIPDFIFHGSFLCKIRGMEYSIYRIPLCAPPTSASVNYKTTTFYRDVFEQVAPLEIHEEDLLDVEEQLRFLHHVIKGAKISFYLPLLKGSFSSWIWSCLGIPPSSIFPSVRCGLEMAILNAIAAQEGSSLLNILHPYKVEEEISERSKEFRFVPFLILMGLLEVAYLAKTLVEEGFTAIKLKVARRADPIEDATVIQEIRKMVGLQIELRADANRNWTYEQAIQFGSYVKNCDLKYIEEPVKDEDDIIKFCEETGLPVALDETMDKIGETPLQKLAKFSHSGIVAVVIKPSVVGGFENAALIARWAQQQGKMAVVSAAFESGLSLSAYIQLSSYFELQSAEICKLMNKQLVPSVAHGLGTYRWLKEDVTFEPLSINRSQDSGFIEASVVDADRILQKFQINRDTIIRIFSEEQVYTYQLAVDSDGFSCLLNVHEIGASIENDVVIFLHGFLGTGGDWIATMKAISGSARCISIDLPGHGGSKIQNHDGKEDVLEPNLSIEVVADVLYKLIHSITPGKVTLVGYSMGARIALYMALTSSFGDKIKGAVIISGSPGLKNDEARKIRMVKDDSRSHALITHGLQIFLESWYSGELWKSLRGHPQFNQIVASRLQHKDVRSLAKTLSDLSIGRQRIAQEMCYEIGHGTSNGDGSRKEIYEIVEVPNCGHAAHLENPLPIIRALRRFLTGLENSSTPNERAAPFHGS